jgi:hypothetical protein
LLSPVVRDRLKLARTNRNVQGLAAVWQAKIPHLSAVVTVAKVVVEVVLVILELLVLIEVAVVERKALHGSVEPKRAAVKLKRILVAVIELEVLLVSVMAGVVLVTVVSGVAGIGRIQGGNQQHGGDQAELEQAFHRNFPSLQGLVCYASAQWMRFFADVRTAHQRCPPGCPMIPRESRHWQTTEGRP